MSWKMLHNAYWSVDIVHMNHFIEEIIHFAHFYMKVKLMVSIISTIILIVSIIQGLEIFNCFWKKEDPILPTYIKANNSID